MNPLFARFLASMQDRILSVRSPYPPAAKQPLAPVHEHHAERVAVLQDIPPEQAALAHLGPDRELQAFSDRPARIVRVRGRSSGAQASLWKGRSFSELYQPKITFPQRDTAPPM